MSGAFDTLADLYDLLTDWDRRLPREVGFLDALFEREGVRTVLDAACGTGAHLAALAEAGYDVTGSDISPEMAARARDRLARSGGGIVHVADFADVGGLVPPRDAVMVVGNSLPNAGTDAAARTALAALTEAVRPGGLLVLHTLNFPALIAGGGGLKPLRRVVGEDAEYLFLKLFEVHPEAVVLDVIALVRRGEEIEQQLVRSSLFPVTLPWYEEVLPALGLEILAAHGGFGGEPYEEESSGDLVLVARKTGGGG